MSDDVTYSPLYIGFKEEKALPSSSPESKTDDKSLITTKERSLNKRFSVNGIPTLPAILAEYFHCRYSLSYYITSKGAENFHIYLWIAKDLCWALDLRDAGMTFGALALGWCCVLAVKAFREGNTEDGYFLIPTFLWLFANYWWMTAELVNNDDDGVHAKNRVEASHIMMAGICFFVIYHAILRPLHVLKGDRRTHKFYSDIGVVCRFSYFKTWRQYEASELLKQATD